MIQAIRGFSDLIDEKLLTIYQMVEQKLKDAATAHGYTEVRLPFVEKSELYNRSIGLTSDIVQKEMYSFTDRNDDQICLRPEGTASCMRAILEHNALYERNRKWFYHGPMFRRERPQKGRYRQFYQFGIEAIGYNEPYPDIEHLILIHELLKDLNLTNSIKLSLNYLASYETREKYKGILQTYYSKYQDQLNELEKLRLTENPLRILDSKDPKLVDINQSAPSLHSCYSNEEEAALNYIRDQLAENSIAFTTSSHLVRGLDYYNGLIYEWVSDQLGAQGTVCGGGRYDQLSTQMHGKHPIPATGFSIGMERLVDHLYQHPVKTFRKVLWISLSTKAKEKSISLCNTLTRSSST